MKEKQYEIKSKLLISYNEHHDSSFEINISSMIIVILDYAIFCFHSVVELKSMFYHT